VVCSPVAEQLALVRRNFELRDLAGRFIHAQPVSLPLDDCTIDVACVSGLLDHIDNPGEVVREVYRVLKPGGKILAVTPAKYNVQYWQRVFLPLLSLFQPGKKGSLPRTNRFSYRGLKRLFTDFENHRIHKRHLRRSELPHLWRWLPMSMMERLMGQVLVLKAFKPLSAAMSIRKAA
jgi:SAM-dependent methyltransferase